MTEPEVRVNAQRVEEVLERVDAAEQEATQLPMVDLWLLCGAKVRIKPIPAVILQLLQTEHPEPEVPISIVQMGGKDVPVPNPDSPAYRRALDQHRLEMGDATLKLMLLRGVEILELAPHMRSYEEDDTWEEELELVGITVPKKALARKVQWLRYRILGYVQDFERIQEACWRLGGVSKEEIAAAEARFQAPSERTTPEGVVEGSTSPDLV